MFSDVVGKPPRAAEERSHMRTHFADGVVGDKGHTDRVRGVGGVSMALALAAAIVAGGLVLSACSSGGSTTATTTTTTQGPSTTQASSTTAATTKAQAGSSYLAAVGPSNSAMDSFSTEAQAWTDSTTDSQAEDQAQPLIAAIRTLEPKLLAIATDYAPAATDLKAEVNAAAAVQGDLASLSNVNFLNASSWTQQFASDAAKLGAASNIVRSDLGLPGSS